MRFKRFGTNKFAWVNVNQYRIKWTEPSISNLQTLVKVFLYNYWRDYFVLEEFTIPGSRLICDFINLNNKIAIEVQGEQHFKFNPHFPNKSRLQYLSAIKRDMYKYKWLEENGFKVIELDEKDIKQLSLKYIKEKFGISLI